MENKEKQAAKKISEYIEKEKGKKEPELPVNFYATLGQKLDKVDEEKAGKNFMLNPWLRGAALGFAVVLTVVMVREYQKQGIIGNGTKLRSAASAEMDPAMTESSKTRVDGIGKSRELAVSSKEEGFGSAKKKEVPVISTGKKMQLDVMKDVDLADNAGGEIYPKKAVAGRAPAANYKMAAVPEAAADMEEVQQTVAEEAPAPAAASGTVNFAVKAPAREGVTMWSGTMSGVTAAQNMVFRDNSSLQLFLNAHPDIRSGMEVDFSTNMVVAVFMGQKPTAGYSVIILSVEEKEDSVVVTYLERVPAKNAVLAQVITSPYAMKVVAKTSKKIFFVKQ
ncbi:MAG: protease complex subunit PrcB family protein [Spirochaetia bacterium]|nr:protease complex subunit PrcB family protein [Spirochaetia bacterium]